MANENKYAKVGVQLKAKPSIKNALINGTILRERSKKYKLNLEKLKKNINKIQFK